MDYNSESQNSKVTIKSFELDTNASQACHCCCPPGHFFCSMGRGDHLTLNLVQPTGRLAQPPRGGTGSCIGILSLVVDSTAGYILGQAHLVGAQLAIYLAYLTVGLAQPPRGWHSWPQCLNQPQLKSYSYHT